MEKRGCLSLDLQLTVPDFFFRPAALLGANERGGGVYSSFFCPLDATSASKDLGRDT